MQLYRNSQDSDLFVPQRSFPEIRVEDLVFSEPEPKHHSRFKDSIIFGMIVLLGFGLIFGIFAFV
jgi:hypothetical protein